MLALASFLATHLLVLFVLATTAWAAGSLLTRTFSWKGWEERLAVPAALGLAALAHLGFLLGAFGLLRPEVLIALILVIHGASFSTWRAAFGALRGISWRSALGWPGLGWITLGLLALAPLLVLGLYPPTGFDETMYHLPFARGFAESGGMPEMPALRFPVFPPLAELLFAETLLLASDVATHCVPLVALLATAGFVVAWGRKVFSPWAGWIAAALFLGNPLVAALSGMAYVEPLLGLFVTGALYAAWNWRQSGDRAWLLLAAVFAGSAAAVKYLGLFFAAAVFVDLVFGRRKLSALQWRAPLLFAFLSFVVLLPTYARITAHTGNPIFPYLPSIFGSTTWDPIAIRPLEDINFPEIFLRYVRLPWDVVFHRSAMGLQPPYSPLYLLGIPLLLLGALRDSRVRGLLVIPVVWGAVFLLLPQDSRYLFSILPPLSLALAASLWVLPRTWPRIERRPLLAMACVLAFLPGWLYGCYRITRQGPPPVTTEERDLYLARKLPLYPAVHYLDRSSSVAYAFHAENMKYFHAGRLYGDWIGPASFQRLFPLVETPEILHRELRKLGATHLLLSKSPGAVRPPGAPEWDRWFRKVYEDPAGVVFVLAA